MLDILSRDPRFKCSHNKFIVDESLEHVECGLCGKELNPMWVLSQLCNVEARFNLKFKHLNKQLALAEKKNRCKCEHCSKITRIQR